MSNVLSTSLALLWGLGYAIALVMVLGIRLYLGDAGRGWPRILLNALLLRDTVMVATYVVALVNLFSPPGELRRAVVSVGLIGAFVVTPYVLIVTLGRWWVGGRQRPTAVVPRRRWPWSRDHGQRA